MFFFIISAVLFILGVVCLFFAVHNPALTTVEKLLFSMLVSFAVIVMVVFFSVIVVIILSSAGIIY